MKARAAISDGRGKLVIDMADVENPQADEVLVQLQASGVCHAKGVIVL